MIEARGGTEIEAPIERVFDYVADAQNESEWLPGAEKVEKTTPGDVGLGTRSAVRGELGSPEARRREGELITQRR